MKTVFGLFSSYSDASATYAALQSQGVEEDSLNIIVEQGVVDSTRDPNQESASMASDALAQRLNGHLAVSTSDVGEVLAVGEIVTIFTRAAAEPTQTGGMVESLVEAGMTQATAEAYVQGINSAGVALAVRTEDDQAASVADLMNRHNGREVANFAG